MNTRSGSHDLSFFESMTIEELEAFRRAVIIAGDAVDGRASVSALPITIMTDVSEGPHRTLAHQGDAWQCFDCGVYVTGDWRRLISIPCTPLLGVEEAP